MGAKKFYNIEKYQGISRFRYDTNLIPIIARGGASDSTAEKETRVVEKDSTRMDYSTKCEIGPPSVVSGNYTSICQEIQLPTLEGISIHDITPTLEELVAKSKIRSGSMTVLSKHTTTSIFIC